MMAEAQEEVMGCKDSMHIIKGKRTKRLRPQSPLALAMVSSSSSAVESGGEGEGERFTDNFSVSPATSVELATSTEEEEDMANCLILLAQGAHTKKLSETRSSNIVATSNKAAVVPQGLYVYQCKTCNRFFPSFQALGGHRASHKKPKLANNEEKRTLVIAGEEYDHFSNMSTTLSLQIANRATTNLCLTNNKSNKVHECSICGAEFSSGQALGGHMRRHRAFMSTTAAATALSMATSSSLDQSQETKKQRNILQLDLNLPAPEDDRRESKFSFASKEQVIVFSASSLVDCHY